MILARERSYIRESARTMATSGLTLVEVLISLSILSALFAGVLGTYVHLNYRAEWSGYSIAAQALAIQQLEQAKSAVWDPRSVPAKNELTNIARVTPAILDLPISGTNVVWATNYATILSVSLGSNPPVSTYLVKVDTVWPFRWKNQVSYYTNTIAGYLAPD
ncbi:MAG TPA: prepilin-type N-terminal cleavage/methylation domain-containing protein [Clostridia bacterium]|nr:prepilin-type N-terminal cleavage/methylation domain-containing protein [Clostridia bacterium]